LNMRYLCCTIATMTKKVTYYQLHYDLDIMPEVKTHG